MCLYTIIKHKVLPFQWYMFFIMFYPRNKLYNTNYVFTPKFQLYLRSFSNMMGFHQMDFEVYLFLVTRT